MPSRVLRQGRLVAVAISLDPDRVDAVLFDMGGVFVLPRPDRVAAALRAGGFDASDDHEIYRRAHYEAAWAYDASDDAPETWFAYLGTYARSLGVDDHLLDAIVPHLDEAWSDGPASVRWTWVQPDAVEGFTRLEGLDLALGVVSNCDGSAELILREAGICHVGPGDLVEVRVIVDSGVVGIEKPDPAIFEPALETIGVDPDRTVYVGDTRRNDVEGARAAGLHPIQLDPYDLYGDHDHDRIRSLHELADWLGAAPAAGS